MYEVKKTPVDGTFMEDLAGRVVKFDVVVDSESVDKASSKEGGGGGGGGRASPPSEAAESEKDGESAQPRNAKRSVVDENEIGKVTKSYLGLVRHVLKNGYEVHV